MICPPTQGGHIHAPVKQTERTMDRAVEKRHLPSDFSRCRFGGSGRYNGLLATHPCGQNDAVAFYSDGEKNQ